MTLKARRARSVLVRGTIISGGLIHLTVDLPLKTKISHFRDDLPSQSVKILPKKLNLTQQTDMHQQTKEYNTKLDSAHLHQGTSYQCRDTDPDLYPRPGSPPKFNHLFTGSLPTFPENFMQSRLEVFVQSC